MYSGRERERQRDRVQSLGYIPIKKFLRDSLLTASYTGEFLFPLTVGRALTECKGSKHTFKPTAL
jgi:hypothetical protein